MLGKWPYASGNLGGRQTLYCFDSSRNGWRALLPAVINIFWKLKRFALIGNNVYEGYSDIHHFIQNDMKRMTEKRRLLRGHDNAFWESGGNVNGVVA